MAAANRMMLEGTTDAADADDEEEGRVLNDNEYAQVLKKRNDIFHIEKTKSLYTIEVVALVISVVFGAWLSTTKAVKIAPDFYQNILKARTARFMRERILSATVPKKMEREANFKGHAVWLDTRRNKLSVGMRKPEERAANRQVPPAVREGMTEEDSILLNRGNALKKLDHAGAIAEFRRVLSHDPNNTGALTGIGDVFLYAGLLDSATSLYQAAIASNPHNALAHNGLGTARYYLSVMAANPHFAEARTIKDPARYIQLQYDSAIAEYTNALSLDSSRVDALTNRGVIRDIHGDHSAAIEDYTRAIKTKPDYAEAYSKRAATYKSLGNYKNALADYTAAIKLGASSYEFDPKLHFTNAYFGRGNVHYQTGDFEKAIADFDSALAIDPNHGPAILNKARALGDAKRYDSAVVWFTKAIALISPMEYNGALEHAYFGRGLMYSLTGQVALAMKDFNEAIKLKPDDRYAYLHRGNLYKSHGSYDSAITDYKNALESQKLAAKSCWRIAECYSLKQNRTDALAWLKKAVSFGFRDFAVWKQDKELSLLWNDKEFTNLTTLPE